MTVWQKQCLLCALGYLTPKEIDGLWGPKSAEATRKLQKALELSEDGIFGTETAAKMLDFLENGSVAEIPDDTGSFWEEIQYFKREEFRCKCGGQYCDGFPAEPKEAMVRIADRLRRNLGVPITVVSGLRCPTWNSIQGGVENSQHMYGEAADICAAGCTQSQVEAELDRIGGVRYHYPIAGSSNVHFDIPKGAG